jgi:hypothetical protein
MSNINNNNTINNSIPGMLLPTQQGMLAGNPRDSAIAQGNAANQKLLSLQTIGGTGRRNRRLRKRGGGASTSVIPVPQFNMQYKPQGGPGQDPNSIIQQNAAVGTQSAANAVYDKYATQMGGHYDINMNTNTNQYQWGCYSGGKKNKRSNMMKISKKKRTKRYSVKRNKLRNRKSRKNKKI